MAGINIKVKSDQGPVANKKIDWRYKNFILKRAPKRVDLEFNLKTTDSYTQYDPEVLFMTQRDQPAFCKKGVAAKRYRERMKRQEQKNNKQREQKEKYLGKGLDWRISKYKGKFLIEGGSSGNFQIFFDKRFKKIDVVIINEERQWKFSDLFTGFLQLLMIYYFAAKKNGLVVHSTAIKDKQKNGQGYLFAGVSGAGKSTSSKIWDKHAGNIIVLNDDRIIIRKINNRFYLYGTPWHGDFSDYLKTSSERARLNKVFFIYHKQKNIAEKVKTREFFNLFFQSLFVPFWSKEDVVSTSEFVMDLITTVPCYKFGFKNNKKIIDYVRNI